MSDAPLPTFSIVIPTYNRPRQLAKCLEALDRLTYPRDRFDVIIVDDGSPTPLAPVVDRMQSDLRVKLHRQSNMGPATARNTGAAQATGEHLAFTDDDCAPHPDWLHRLGDALKRSPDALVGGRVVNALEHNLFSAASQALVSYLYEYYNADGGRARFFTSNNFAVRAEAFRAVNGFDTTYPRAAGEDREFCDRWDHLGRPLVYAADAVIKHFHKLTPRSFWRQHYNYGRGAYSYHAARARRNVAPMKVEPMSFYFNLLGYPLRKGNTGRARDAVWVSMLMLVSQVANTAGFFAEKMSQRRTMRPYGRDVAGGTSANAGSPVTR